MLVLPCCLYLFCGLTRFADAWWDQGHLLVAAIARLGLPDEDVRVLEAPLRLLDTEYPGLNSIVTAAVWLDHIKCRTSTYFCEGTPSLDGIEVFNSWHYVSQVYNPESLVLPEAAAALPYPETGAVWALSSLFGEDVQRQLRRLHWDAQWNYTKPPHAHGLGVRRSRRDVESDLNAIGARPLSPFSWNLKLRFLIHVFGDIHQPLHTAETFSRQFPLGDSGGSAVPVDLGTGSSTNITDMHELWDACGGLYQDSWPAYSEAAALERARQLIEEFPRDTLNPESAMSFADVAHESFNIATTQVYKEFNFTGTRNAASEQRRETLPYRPSPEYMTTVQSLCRRQITLGGYRLAMVLTDIAHLLRHARWSDGAGRR